jgi:nucleoside-diphosphate-sugar epimerase
MHSDDLAWVIKECITNEIYDSFNVATNQNLSIKEMAEIALKVLNLEYINLKFDDSKPDGQYRKDVNTTKLNYLFPNFNPLSFEEGIKKVYDKISK